MGLVVLLAFLAMVRAWPNGAGSCETARGGHYEQKKGSGGFEVIAKVRQSDSEATLVTLTLGTAHQLKGFVLRTTLGTFVELRDGAQPMECSRPSDPFNGPANSTITHTSRQLKGPFELTLRIPEAACEAQPPEGCIGHLQVIAMQDIGNWFKFYQTITLAMKGGVDLSVSISEGRAEHPPRAEL
jgi:hypothetical protein